MFRRAVVVTAPAKHKIQGLLSVASDYNSVFEVFTVERAKCHLRILRVVLHQQYFHSIVDHCFTPATRSGSSCRACFWGAPRLKKKVAPLSISASTQIRPPCL